MRTIADIDILGDEPFQARVAQLSLAVIVAAVLAAVVLGLAVDGEKLDGTHFEIDVVPHALRVIC